MLKKVALTIEAKDSPKLHLSFFERIIWRVARFDEAVAMGGQALPGRTGVAGACSISRIWNRYNTALSALSSFTTYLPKS